MEWTLYVPIIFYTVAEYFIFISSDNHIYAVGGFNTRRLRSVERYDPESDTWTYVTSMEKERSHLQAVVYNGKIYAVGGKVHMGIQLKLPLMLLWYKGSPWWLHVYMFD